jgi:hypothetical protein
MKELEIIVFSFKFYWKQTKDISIGIITYHDEGI